MPSTDDIARLTAYAEAKLPLATAALSESYFYQSLPLCIIDAVFSIGVRYSGTRQVVIRYCEYTQQRRVRDGTQLPPIEDQESISEFCARPDQVDPEGMAGAVYGNRQRTSSRSGVLKAEAAYKFAAVLRSHGVEHLQDMARVARNTALEEDFKTIPGHPSGIASRYLFMLAGHDAFAKPDRMIQRFIKAAIGREVTDPAEAADLVAAAADRLKALHPALTPRLLDHEIWKMQRGARSSP